QKNNDIITSFTNDAAISGVYNELIPNDMSGWVGASHEVFGIQSGSPFVPFEIDPDGNNVTIAKTSSPVPYGNQIQLSITDDIDECAFRSIDGFIDSYINYQICYSTSCDLNDVNIISELPEYAEFDSCDGNGIYDPNLHQVVWNLSDRDSNDANCFTLTVKVPDYAIEGSNFINTAKIYTGNSRIRTRIETTNICCFENVVYVDKDAVNGMNNGSNWDNAYLELRDAIAAVKADVHGCANQIWIAAGTYKPVYDMNSGYTDKRFELIDNIALIGHFGGVGIYETSPDQRVLNDANNTTVLEGRIGTTHSQAVKQIVYAYDVSNALLDGFTIRNAYKSDGGFGLYIDDSDVSILNCRFENNFLYGIFAKTYSYPDIHNCMFFNNRYGLGTQEYSQSLTSYSIFDGNNVNNTYGVTMSNGCSISLEECILKNNKTYGLSGSNCSLIVNSSQFTNNQSGIYLNDVTTDFIDSTITNSTQYCLYSLGSEIDIKNSSFTNSTQNCLYFASSSVASIENSSIENSTGSGINATNSNIMLENSRIEGSTNSSGMYSSSSIVTVKNSSIINNAVYGIGATDSDVNVSHSLLANNYDNALYLSSGGNGSSNLALENSVIRYSGGHGLKLIHPITTTIKNCWIHNNGTRKLSSYGRAGIYLEGPAQTPFIRNCTIYDNNTYGIEMNQYGPDPNVRNCIIFGNDVNDFYRPAAGDPFDAVRYSCLQHSRNGAGNFVADPMLMTSTDPNNLHLNFESPCINAGDPCGIYANETDIDGEIRNNGIADCGADESFWSYADYDLNGIVEFRDFASLANVWLTESKTISLDDDNDVDIYDLALFCRDWLWQDQTGSGWMMSMMMGGGQGDGMEMIAESQSMSLDTIETETLENDSLMINDIQTSKALMPKKLADKVKSFYAITPESVAQWKAKQTLQIEPGAMSLSSQQVRAEEIVDVNGLLNWLDDMWQNDVEIRNSMTEAEYQEFRNSIQQSDE
ncbi:MAG: right-handed parallel beta-helix repeat-containing protein, partial [Phycisphaerales bacterium]